MRPGSSKKGIKAEKHTRLARVVGPDHDQPVINLNLKIGYPSVIGDSYPIQLH